MGAEFKSALVKAQGDGDAGGAASGFSFGRRCATGGWSRGWTDEAKDAVESLRDSPVVAAVANDLIDAVRGTLRPQKGADAASFVRQLGSRLREFSPPVLTRTAQHLLDTRGGYLPAASEIAKVAAAVAKDLALNERSTASGSKPPQAGSSVEADPALTARWPEVCAVLRRKLGDDTVKVWFDSMQPERLQNGQLKLVVPNKFFQRWIRENYLPDILVAAQQVLGMVSKIDLATVRTSP